MRRYRVGYLAATRHPQACLFFLLPLLAAYELGVCWLGGPQPEALRNGADTWLRWALEAFGLPSLYCAPGLILVVFVIWSGLRRWDRPEQIVRLWVGMAVESVVFAVGLWLLSRRLGPWLDSLGVRLTVGPNDKVLGRIITYVGAGIYEEMLFRLLLFFALGRLFRLAAPLPVAALLTLLLSGILFSAAHHLGPYGEPAQPYVVLFRTLAGVYFGLLYQLRGFGVVVGAHACYDVLVGVLVV
jgi:membrane protease YdiL (CAAX protease family)